MQHRRPFCDLGFRPGFLTPRSVRHARKRHTDHLGWPLTATITVAILAQGTHRAVATSQAFLLPPASYSTPWCMPRLYTTTTATSRKTSLHWGLSPGPSVYRTDALPLSYRGLSAAAIDVLKHTQCTPTRKKNRLRLSNRNTPCGTRTHNLRIRSPTPCPLGQGALLTVPQHRFHLRLPQCARPRTLSMRRCTPRLRWRAEAHRAPRAFGRAGLGNSMGRHNPMVSPRLRKPWARLGFASTCCSASRPACVQEVRASELLRQAIQAADGKRHPPWGPNPRPQG